MYLVDEFIVLFVVLMKEMRTLGESKVSCADEGNEKVGSEMGRRDFSSNLLRAGGVI